MLKKLFSLVSLLAISSGIPSFAQNIGVGYKSDGSDVSGDFAEAEGDGASVSADVTVGFKIGKKIAIAIKQPDGSFTTNPIFHPTTGNFDPDAMASSLMWLDNPDFSPMDANRQNMSKSALWITGGIYANTDVSITVDPSKEFVNEDDPSSIVKAWYSFDVADRYGSGRSQLFQVYDDLDSSTSNFPMTRNIGVSDFSANGGVLAMYLTIYFYRDTIDATDRSGNYYASSTITVTAL